MPPQPPGATLADGQEGTMISAIVKPSTTLGEGSKRKPSRLAGPPALIATSLAMLIVGIVIGNAARKRIDRWTHAYV